MAGYSSRKGHADTQEGESNTHRLTYKMILRGLTVYNKLHALESIFLNLHSIRYNTWHCDEQTSPAHADFRLLARRLISSVPKQLNCLPLKPCHFQTLKSWTVLFFSVFSNCFRVKRTPSTWRKPRIIGTTRSGKKGNSWRKWPLSLWY